MRLSSLQSRPLILVVAFNLITLLVFLTAPFQWATDNLSLLTLMVVISQLSIAIGFYLGYRSFEYTVPRNQIFHRISSRGQSLILIFCLLTLPLKYAYLVRLYPQDIGGIIAFLFSGIRDPHLGYSLAIDPTNEPTIRWSIYFLISIIHQLIFIMGFLCWKEYNIWKKSCFLFLLATEAFYFMGTARNFGVIFLISTFSFTLLLRIKVLSPGFTRGLKYSVVLLLLLIASICIFSYNLHARGNVTELDFRQFDLLDAAVARDSSVFAVVPTPLHRTYLYVVSYLCQGYYNTCVAFDLDFKWTYFVGNNPAIINLIEACGFKVWEDTYIFRLGEMGVDPLLYWHSAYLWFASDVSFVGVPFLLLIFGYVFGFSLALGSKRYDLLSKIIFVITGNVLLYLFANNTYLSSVFYSLVFILPIWCYTRLIRTFRRH
jgi:hypothetical protein